MRFEEWRESHAAFKLVGGPFDGEDHPCEHLNGWPSEIAIEHKGGFEVYAMRVGDLCHYDYSGHRDALIARGD